MKTKYLTTIESRIAGIPCLIGVSYYFRQPGSYSYNAASDMDYYGYTEFDYAILDRKGYKAAWLEKKMTAADKAFIEEQIAEYF